MRQAEAFDRSLQPLVVPAGSAAVHADAHPRTCAADSAGRAAFIPSHKSVTPVNSPSTRSAVVHPDSPGCAARCARTTSTTAGADRTSPASTIAAVAPANGFAPPPGTLVPADRAAVQNCRVPSGITRHLSSRM